MENYMIWIWLAIFIITFIVEAATSDLVSIWFSIGAVVSIILSLIEGIPYYVEIIVFAVLSLVLLIATRPMVKKILKNQERKTNADDLIGKTVKVMETITEDLHGTIKINDVIYTASLSDNDTDTILEGTKVKIIGINGNKVIVKRIKDDDILNF